MSAPLRRSLRRAGAIPSELGELVSLKSIDLHHTGLYGEQTDCFPGRSSILPASNGSRGFSRNGLRALPTYKRFQGTQRYGRLVLGRLVPEGRPFITLGGPGVRRPHFMKRANFLPRSPLLTDSFDFGRASMAQEIFRYRLQTSATWRG